MGNAVSEGDAGVVVEAGVLAGVDAAHPGSVRHGWLARRDSARAEARPVLAGFGEGYAAAPTGSIAGSMVAGWLGRAGSQMAATAAPAAATVAAMVRARPKPRM